MTALRLHRPFGAALALVTLTLSQPLAAADFQLDNVRMEFGLVTLSAPKLEVKGSALEREAFRSLLDIKSGETALARIDRLSAAESARTAPVAPSGTGALPCPGPLPPAL